jgi:hypothetical protein
MKIDHAIVEGLISKVDPMKVYSIREVAEIVGYTHQGIVKWIRLGRLTVGKVAGRYAISGQAIVDCLRNWK